MDYSLAGLLGAFVGTVLGVINYVAIIGLIMRRLPARNVSNIDEERSQFEHNLSWVRQLVLALDILIFASVGYWFGETIGG
jgi:uncharacterized membrane protein